MEKQLNWKYRAIHFLMTCMFGAALAFASVYLLDKGFNSTSIGTLISVSSILSIFMQTGLASLIDTNKAIKIQDVLSVSNLIIIAASVILVFVTNNIFVAVLMTIVLTMVKTHIPFVNSLAFIFADKGIYINFGIGRAYGSLAYALSTVLIGQVVEYTSPSILPFFYIFFTVLYIFVVKSYDIKPEQELHHRIEVTKADSAIKSETDSAPAIEATETVEAAEEISLTYPEFFKRYPKLVFLALGTVFIMFSQSFVNTFFIQVITPVGGNNAMMGTAIFIAGAVEFPVIMSLDTLSKKISVAKLIKISTFFFIAKNVLLFMAPNMTWVYISQFLSFGANALLSPTFVQYINEVVDLKDLVKGQSLATIGMTLAGVFASFLGGLMIDYLGIQMALLIGIVVTVVGALTILIFANEPVSRSKPEPPKTVGLAK